MTEQKTGLKSKLNDVVQVERGREMQVRVINRKNTGNREGTDKLGKKAWKGGGRWRAGAKGKQRGGKPQVTWLGLLNKYKTGLEGIYCMAGGENRKIGNKTVGKGSNHTTNPTELIDRTMTVIA